MSRALRRISRNQQAVKVLMDLSKAIPALKQNIEGVAKALPTHATTPEVQVLLDALVEDCQTLARENEILRESFLRLLIILSEDSEENIRKVEAEIRANLLKEHEGT